MHFVYYCTVLKLYYTTIVQLDQGLRRMAFTILGLERHDLKSLPCKPPRDLIASYRPMVNWHHGHGSYTGTLHCGTGILHPRSLFRVVLYTVGLPFIQWHTLT